MAKIILVQPINSVDLVGAVPGFQTDYSHSRERDNTTEATKMGSISAIGSLTETMELSMYYKQGSAGQTAFQDAIEKGEEIKVWEIQTVANEEGTFDARFGFAVIDSFDSDSPVEGLEELSVSLTIQGQTKKGVFATLPEGLVNFATYGFQLPGETTGPSTRFVPNPDFTPAPQP